jgi:Rieske Fe-S protein
MTDDERMLPVVSRRTVLIGVGVASVAVLGGCATYGPGTTTGGGNQNGDDGGDGVDETEKPLQTTDVPVGGGIIVDGRNVVVTQPQKGTFKAFTAICTHQGCTVSDVRNGTINCPCHGSKFSPRDGSVVAGPATRPLHEVTITVVGTNITFG